MTRELTRQQNRLDELFKRVDGIDDPYLQAHFARYLCVLLSGYLEYAVYEIFSDYARRTAHKRVAGYVERRLDDFYTPSTERLLALAGEFDRTWREDLEHRLTPEMREAINSIRSLRNQIAHGENMGVSYATMRDYYTRIKQVVAALQAVTNPV